MSEYYDTPDEQMDELTVQELLKGMFEESDLEYAVDRCSTFKEAGVMSWNKGLTVGFADGTEFQITIVRRH